MTRKNDGRRRQRSFLVVLLALLALLLGGLCDSLVLFLLFLLLGLRSLCRLRGSRCLALALALVGLFLAELAVDHDGDRLDIESLHVEDDLAADRVLAALVLGDDGIEDAKHEEGDVVLRALCDLPIC